MGKKEITGATVLGTIFILGLIIVFSQQMVIFFGLVTLFGFIISIITGIIDINENEFYYSIIPLIFTGISFLLFLIFAFVGFGIGGTEIGQASVQTYESLSVAEEEISKTFDQAIQETIQISCETLDEQNCNLLRTFSESAETLEEVANYANKLKKGVGIVNKIK